MDVNVKREALTGNEAIAYAWKQINPDVVAAYPITPQTALVQKFADFVADGLVQTEVVPVESEHSAMSTVVGASAAGARAMTATSANGLALMWEIVYIAASLRLPIVMAVVNRALSGPINIHCDHSDTMGCRDSGWIQLYCENGQEAYDLTIQAVRLAERHDVLLPCMVCIDGFIISHEIEDIELLPDDVVKEFVGEREPLYPLLDVDNPVTYGPLDLYDYYFEHKRQQAEAYKNVIPAFREVAAEFEKIAGRRYEIMEPYRLEDAEVGVIALGSTNGTAEVAIDRLREQGLPVGLLKLRMFRPFPWEELRDAVKHLKALGVMDRVISFGGFGGPLFAEVRSALFGLDEAPFVLNYIYGLGGRDIDVSQIEGVLGQLLDIARTGEVAEWINYVGVRE